MAVFEVAFRNDDFIRLEAETIEEQESGGLRFKDAEDQLIAAVYTDIRYWRKVSDTSDTPAPSDPDDDDFEPPFVMGPTGFIR